MLARRETAEGAASALTLALSANGGEANGRDPPLRLLERGRSAARSPSPSVARAPSPSLSPAASSSQALHAKRRRGDDGAASVRQALRFEKREEERSEERSRFNERVGTFENATPSDANVGAALALHPALLRASPPRRHTTLAHPRTLSPQRGTATAAAPARFARTLRDALALHPAVRAPPPLPPGTPAEGTPAERRSALAARPPFVARPAAALRVNGDTGARR